MKTTKPATAGQAPQTVTPKALRADKPNSHKSRIVIEGLIHTEIDGEVFNAKGRYELVLTAESVRYFISQIGEVMADVASKVAEAVQ